MGLNFAGPLIMWIFSHKYIDSHPYPWFSHPWIQPSMDGKQYFQSTVGDLCMQKADLNYTRIFNFMGIGPPNLQLFTGQQYRDSVNN